MSLNQCLCLVRAKSFSHLLMNIAYDVVLVLLRVFLDFNLSVCKGFLLGVAGVQRDPSGSGVALEWFGWGFLKSLRIRAASSN